MQPAMVLPELAALWKEDADYYRQSKMVMDEYQVEEFENNIHYAMEYHLPIRFRLHKEGNSQELHGYCVYIHPFTKELRIQKKDSSFEKIQFNEIIGVIVED
ncbi:YolD-like family protein [Peribacillus sp. NPDC076916]|uniref:YolD-like family protein n=1 Tax=Peribacillus sp. NPDC076916 TaxID=3390608 RepID=UPI003D00A1C1